MTRVTEDLVRCFLRLKAPEFSPLVEWLASVHQKTLEDMVTVGEEVNWRRLQGRAQFLKEVRQYIEGSPELMGKFKQ